MSDDLVMKANNQSIEKSIDLSNKSGLDIILDCSSDWKRYIKILENFKKTNFFNNKNKILFSKRHLTEDFNLLILITIMICIMN